MAINVRGYFIPVHFLNLGVSRISLFSLLGFLSGMFMEVSVRVS